MPSLRFYTHKISEPFFPIGIEKVDSFNDPMGRLGLPSDLVGRWFSFRACFEFYHGPYFCVDGDARLVSLMETCVIGSRFLQGFVDKLIRRSCIKKVFLINCSAFTAFFL